MKWISYTNQIEPVRAIQQNALMKCCFKNQLLIVMPQISSCPLKYQPYKKQTMQVVSSN